MKTMREALVTAWNGYFCALVVLGLLAGIVKWWFVG